MWIHFPELSLSSIGQEEIFINLWLDWKKAFLPPHPPNICIPSDIPYNPGKLQSITQVQECFWFNKGWVEGGIKTKPHNLAFAWSVNARVKPVYKGLYKQSQNLQKLLEKHKVAKSKSLFRVLREAWLPKKQSFFYSRRHTAQHFQHWLQFQHQFSLLRL